MGNRVRENPEVRREQILDAALTVFAEQGPRGATMRGIARATGVNEGLIYHYFDDKDALIEELLRRIERGRDGVLSCLDPELSLRENFERVRDYIGRLPEGDSRGSRPIRFVMGVAADGDPKTRRMIGGMISRGIDRLESLFVVASRRGEIDVPDCRIAARHLASGIALSFVQRRMLEMSARDRVPIVEIMDCAFHVFMNGAAKGSAKLAVRRRRASRRGDE